jgi:hypothetical protein
MEFQPGPFPDSDMSVNIQYNGDSYNDPNIILHQMLRSETIHENVYSLYIKNSLLDDP